MATLLPKFSSSKSRSVREQNHKSPSRSESSPQWPSPFSRRLTSLKLGEESESWRGSIAHHQHADPNVDINLECGVEVPWKKYSDDPQKTRITENKNPRSTPRTGSLVTAGRAPSSGSDPRARLVVVVHYYTPPPPLKEFRMFSHHTSGVRSMIRGSFLASRMSFASEAYS